MYILTIQSHQKRALSFLLAREQDDEPRGDCMEDCEGGTSQPKNGYDSFMKSTCLMKRLRANHATASGVL